MTRAALLVLLLSGCAASKGCFLGLSLLPPIPVLICGIDAAPADKGE